MSASSKQLIGRVAIAGVLGGTAGTAAAVAYRFAVALSQILNRGQSVSRLRAVVPSFWASSQAVKGWAMLGALVGAGIVLLRLSRIGSARRSAPVVLLLALWTTWLAAFGWFQYQRYDDRAAIRVRYAQFCEDIFGERFEAAYNQMTLGYRSTHTIGEFKADERIGGELLSAVKIFGCDLHPQHHIEVWRQGATLYPRAFVFSDTYSGLGLKLEEADGEWYFTGESHWYSD